MNNVDINKIADHMDSEWVDPFAGMYSIPHEDGQKLSMYKVNADVTTGKGKNGRGAIRIASAYMALGGKCCVCGEDDWNTLEIDHIHGDGKLDREKFPHMAAQKFDMLKDIVQNGPQGRYQLLCGNCHNKKTAKQMGYDKNLNKPV